MGWGLSRKYLYHIIVIVGGILLANKHLIHHHELPIPSILHLFLRPIDFKEDDAFWRSGDDRGVGTGPGVVSTGNSAPQAGYIVK